MRWAKIQIESRSNLLKNGSHQKVGGRLEKGYYKISLLFGQRRKNNFNDSPRENTTVNNREEKKNFDRSERKQKGKAERAEYCDNWKKKQNMLNQKRKHKQKKTFRVQAPDLNVDTELCSTDGRVVRAKLRTLPHFTKEKMIWTSC
ncbi:hypothetical protein PoB_005507000 [Plakobranchus ocellatus]|uniref:Uncharacterized protein n=1 Tax=Plakobranchus ocellatus TaxID=259542 RepID=A0AAV4CA38_9GAST|nr:hypothetical protein PoB_005507000 [Plakobranchus ocellatus]